MTSRQIQLRPSSTIEKGLKVNKVKWYDQVTKSRGFHPKVLIPITVDNMEKTWRILSDVYGDPSRGRRYGSQKEVDSQYGTIP
jgi:hypothetical protein